MQLTFPENEHWQWVEVYEKEYIPQFKKDGTNRHFHDIDFPNLKSFVMVHESEKMFIITPSEKDKWRLIHFYKCGKQYRMDGKNELVNEFRIPVAGYQVTKDGRNFKSLCAFLDDGTIQVIYE